MAARKINKVLVQDEAERPSTDLENILDSQADNQSLADTINHKIYSLIERLARKKVIRLKISRSRPDC
jgi:hypothetical protein